MNKKILIILAFMIALCSFSIAFAESIYPDSDPNWDGNADGCYMSTKSNITKDDLVILLIQNGEYSYYARIPGTTDLKIVESGNAVGNDFLGYVIKNGEDFQYGSRCETQCWAISKTVKENIYAHYHFVGTGEILDGVLLQKYDSFEKIKSAVKSNKELIGLAQKENPSQNASVANKDKDKAKQTTQNETKKKVATLVKGTNLPAGYYFREDKETQYLMVLTADGKAMSYLSENDYIYEIVKGTEKQFLSEMLKEDMCEFVKMKLIGKNKFSLFTDVLTYSFKNNVFSYTVTPKGLKTPQKCEPFKYIGDFEALKKMLLKK